MIHFRTLTELDRELVQSYTRYNDRRGSDISFANLIGWHFMFNTQIAEVNGYLLFRLNFFGNLAYLMPVAKPRTLADGSLGVEPCDVCDFNVIMALMEDSASLGRPFMMSGVTRHMADLLEELMPGVFDINPARDYSDYVYAREKLENLAGKKLQSKRNHINKFLKLYPDWEYKPLTKELIPACKQLLRQWRATKEAGEPMDSQSMESRAVTRCFNRWDSMGLIGGTLWVGDRLVAFTYGCPINHDTIDVCVEKADVNYEGAFTMVNREFVRHLPEQFVYINREEDMGEEGLRKAKLSYHPDILLEKILVTEKSPARHLEDSQNIRKECMQLWRDTFDDPEEYVQTYFSRIYRAEDNVCISEGGHVAAAAQTIPFTLACHGADIPAAYISGVAVKDALRGQKIGTELMRLAHFNLYNKGVAFAVLIPAGQRLREWYSGLGYVSCIDCTLPPEGAADMTYGEWSALMRSGGCAMLAPESWFSVAQEELRRSGGQSPAPVKGMVRVIDALRALQLYAEMHPEANLRLRVTGDEVIPANNTYYTISGGKVLQSEEPDEAARKLTLTELAEMVFDDLQATMTLMLN